MDTFERIIDKAKANPKRIILPETDDERIIEAASIISERGLAEISLIGNEKEIVRLAKKNGATLNSVEIVDPNNSVDIDRYCDALYQKRKHKSLTEDKARELIFDPLIFAAVMVSIEDADGCVAGAVNTTSDVVKAALQIIGMNPGSDIVSSFFLMQHEMTHQAIQGTALYADCALVVNPDSDQLASIAIASADSARNLAGIEPKVAMLSFSTAGSANHPNVDKVRRAGEIVLEKRPDIEIMTEVQFDAAVIPEVLSQKAPAILTKAPANVFIFPELQSANIGYKIAQRIGGVKAVGPILQGLRKPVNDLSRGCSVDDIVQLVGVTSTQANSE